MLLGCVFWCTSFNAQKESKPLQIIDKQKLCSNLKSTKHTLRPLPVYNKTKIVKPMLTQFLTRTFTITLLHNITFKQKRKRYVSYTNAT